jgi:hypothetical protein
MTANCAGGRLAQGEREAQLIAIGRNGLVNVAA